MVQLSAALEEALWGDDAVLRYIQMAKDAFDRGERDALLGLVFLCARFQAVIPDWAVDALLAIETGLENGTLSDFNAAFGWDGENVAARKRRARQRRLLAPVLLELQAARLGGASLNADDINTRVVQSLRSRGMKLSRRDVDEIRREHGGFLKDLPRVPDPNHRYGQAHATIDVPRRSGRAILND